MKNNFSRMTGASFGLSFDTPTVVGGGTAVAPAPIVTPAPAPAAAAPVPASAMVTPPASKQGFFKGLARAATVAAPESAPVVAEKVKVFSDDQKTVLFEGSQADAEAFVKNGGKPPIVAPAPVVAPKVTAGALPRPFVGRADITTLEQAEDLYRKSGQEAIRLHEKAKTLEANLQKATVDAEARAAALTAELELARKTPAVIEKTDAELEAMAKENPYQFHKYMETKTARERALQDARETAQRAVREKHEASQKGAKQAMATWDAMLKDPKAYPKFQELTPAIDAIYDALPPAQKSQFDSNPDGPKVLYEIALGRVYLDLLSKGIEVKADASEQARLKAESDAAASLAAGGVNATVAAPDTRTLQQKNDDEWRANRAKARGENPGSRIFRGRTTT